MQTEREAVMSEFRMGSIRVLITSDLLARGIDVQQNAVVINYDIPSHLETYIHRYGRTGRFGRNGIIINFTTNNDLKLINEISEKCDLIISPLPSKDFMEVDAPAVIADIPIDYDNIKFVSN